MAENKAYVTTADERGSVNISEEVIAVIAGSAAAEVDGVAALYPPIPREGGTIGRRAFAKSARITIDDRNVIIDVYLTASLGAAINEVGAEVQRAVANAVESATGLAVLAVNVHIAGISNKR
ncbi:MAG: Asp23/Gls24 family envelope stress response protein [Oscillospiraceae bacterium]|jgi:uncharacterized alkaline shock family protein YloU|nr:Asp23/Gls24 family envelope stress response protein [Oscillospiraceae bacterium]